MLERLLVDRMENRILVGITMFVAIMVLVGWVAINENARMQSFERQYLARSIERGAEKFAANCSTCHGVDGRGLEGRAPALNSPHLFGFDYFADIDRQLKALNDEETALNEELAALAEEFAGGVDKEREDAILARRQEISDRVNGTEGIVTQRASLLEQRDLLIEQLQPAVDKGYPIYTRLDENSNEVLVIESNRLTQLEWGSTLYDFLFSTVSSGRPTSVGYWPQAMQPWSQRAGGPLRDDQIQDITNYILNWDKGDNWTIEDALAVNQFGIVPGLPGEGGGADVPPTGSDVAAILQRLEEQQIVGDPTRGDALYHNNERPERGGPRYGCSGCHAGGAVAPNTDGTWDRTVNERLTLPQFEGYTPQQYVIESIVHPEAYIVEGYASGQMPGDFGQRMSLQDIADIVAYLETTTAAGGE